MVFNFKFICHFDQREKSAFVCRAFFSAIFTRFLPSVEMTALCGRNDVRCLVEMTCVVWSK